MLTVKAPTVTLTRVQSGVGALIIQAACSEAVGDLLLGCAYQFRSAASSVVQRGSGLTLAPKGTRRPVIEASALQFETLTVDLLQNHEIERLIVYSYSASGSELHWGGTLIVQTLGGARIEVPLTQPRASGVLVALSLYNIAGEFVLRAENQLVGGTVRDACASFGFDEIAWLDERTPLP